MKKLVFFILVLKSFWGCQNQPLKEPSVEKVLQSSDSNQKKQNDDRLFHPSKYASKFKFHNLNEFRIDKTEDSILISTLKELDSLDYIAIIQDTTNCCFNKEFKYFFYSDFSDSSRITMLILNKGSSSYIITQYMYNAKGKLIGQDDLASDGGHDYMHWTEYGKFINKQYFKTRIFEGNERIYQYDSCILKHTFFPDGEVKIDSVSDKYIVSEKRKDKLITK